jgi:hypothetical protein
MPSIAEQFAADREAFLDQHRRLYLVGICSKRAIFPTDIRRAALIEARAMIELAETLTPKD